MNNEPIAWTNKDELAKYRPIIAEKEYSIHFPIPLYTHPVKELTDEEVLQQAEWIFGTHFFECIDDPYWIEFARAILRKAQEK